MALAHIVAFMFYFFTVGLVVLLAASVQTAPSVLVHITSKAADIASRRHTGLAQEWQPPKTMVPPQSAQLHCAIEGQLNYTRGRSQSGVMAPDIVIMGFGDSGTRGVKAMMEALGVAMCSNTNRFGDNWFTEKTHVYIPELLEAAKGHVSEARGYISSTVFLESVQAELKHVERTLRCAIRSRGLNEDSLPADFKWGWKNPKHIYLLPVMDAAFHCNQKMLAVARDPRDVCTARNQRQFEHFGGIVLRHAFTKQPAQPCLEFWSAVWTSVLQEYAHNERFLIVRIEDLVIHDPKTSNQSYKTLQRMVELAGISPSTDEMHKQLEIAHQHNNSYMGHHYGEGGKERKREEDRTASSSHRVHEVMQALGYHVTHYGLTTPKHPRVISP